VWRMSHSVFGPTWSLGPSLTSVHHHFQSIGTPRLYLTFSMSVDRLYAPHLHTNTAKRHVAHTLTQWLVSKLNQQIRASPDNHPLETRHTRAHINLVFANILGTHRHTDTAGTCLTVEWRHTNLRKVHTCGRRNRNT